MLTRQVKKATLKNAFLIILFLSILSFPLFGGETHPTWIPTPEVQAVAPWVTRPDDVYMGRLSVSSALGRILLIRKGSEYCALKFTNTWLGKGDYEHYTSYEYYYQGDGSGDFSKENVKFGKGEFFYPGRTVFLGHPSYLKGRIYTFQVGKIKVEWDYTTGVYFRKNELAPTPWTSIEEVNLNDPRIKWYKQDRSRKRTTIHIDQLWPKEPTNDVMNSDSKERAAEKKPQSVEKIDATEALFIGCLVREV